MSHLEDTLAMAEALSPLEKVRLMEKLAASLEQDLQPRKPRRSLYGIWNDVQVSAEDIDEARREMWSNFPRDDI